MKYGNTGFSKSEAQKLSKSEFVKAHKHLEGHVGGADLGDIYDALTAKPEEAEAEGAKKVKKA